MHVHCIAYCMVCRQYENPHRYSKKCGDGILTAEYTSFSCLRKFNDARYLKKHIARIHEGRQDFLCESCPKAFSLRDELTKHVKKVHKYSEQSTMTLD